MANETKNEDLKVVIVEYKVSMYCNACERAVAKTISKFKGVETFTTDMNKHNVMVKGSINPQKLLKKLKKKTGKKVEIVENKKEEESPQDVPDERNAELEGVSLPLALPPFFDYCFNDQKDVLMMFSDENPNACSIT